MVQGLCFKCGRDTAESPYLVDIRAIDHKTGQDKGERFIAVICLDCYDEIINEFIKSLH